MEPSIFFLFFTERNHKMNANNSSIKVKEGFLSLDEALKELVRIAEMMQKSHRESTLSKGDKDRHLLVFGIRKAGLNSLLNLVEEYIKEQ